MKSQITSVFIVTPYKTNKQEEVIVDATGQEAILFLRKKYPRFTKFVLDGFEINGNFTPLDLRTYNRI